MRRWLVAIAVLFAMAGTVCGADVYQEEAEILGAGALSEGLTGEAADLMDGFSPTEPTDFASGFQKIVSGVMEGIDSWGRKSVRTCALLLAVCLSCGICGCFKDRHSGAAVRMAGCLGIVTICTSSLYGMIALAQETLDALGNFSALLLPVLSSALAASGGVTSGGALYAGATLLIGVLTSLIRSFLIPCVYCYLFLAAAECAVGDERLGQLRDLAGWTVKTALRAAVAAFTAYLTLTGLLAGASDEMTLKAAKSVISTTIPVVGSMISEASQAVLTSAALIKNASGAFGLLAVLAVGLGPFVQIGIRYLTLRAAAALSGFLAEKEHAGLLGAAAEAMGYMLAMTGSAMLMVIVAVCAFLKAVNG